MCHEIIIDYRRNKYNSLVKGYLEFPRIAQIMLILPIPTSLQSFLIPLSTLVSAFLNSRVISRNYMVLTHYSMETTSSENVT